MARVTHAGMTALGTKTSVYTANAADLTMTAATPADDEQAAHNGKMLLIAHNTGGSPYTITVSSVVDALGRTGDISAYSLGAGEYAVFGPFELEGWLQTTGYLNFEAENAAVKFGVVRL